MGGTLTAGSFVRRQKGKGKNSGYVVYLVGQDKAWGEKHETPMGFGDTAEIALAEAADQVAKAVHYNHLCETYRAADGSLFVLHRDLQGWVYDIVHPDAPEGRINPSAMLPGDMALRAVRKQLLNHIGQNDWCPGQKCLGCDRDLANHTLAYHQANRGNVCETCFDADNNRRV